MSGMDKANAFAAEAHAQGWTTQIESKNGDEVHLKASRNDEMITIWWRGNSLIETPFHHFAGTVRSLHNKATATRQLSLRPDPAKIIKRRKQTQELDLSVGEDGLLKTKDLESLKYPLPFDIWDSTDGEILKELRGSNVVVVNRISGRAEAVHIPRSMNMNLSHFNLMESVDGKPYLNFVTPAGFRSIHLESILRVM